MINEITEQAIAGQELGGCFLVFQLGTLDLLLMMLMAEIRHQLRLVVYPIIYKALYIPGG